MASTLFLPAQQSMKFGLFGWQITENSTYKTQDGFRVEDALVKGKYASFVFPLILLDKTKKLINSGEVDEKKSFLSANGLYCEVSGYSFQKEGFAGSGLYLKGRLYNVSGEQLQYSMAYPDLSLYLTSDGFLSYNELVRPKIIVFRFAGWDLKPSRQYGNLAEDVILSLPLIDRELVFESMEFWSDGTLVKEKVIPSAVCNEFEFNGFRIKPESFFLDKEGLHMSASVYFNGFFEETPFQCADLLVYPEGALVERGVKGAWEAGFGRNMIFRFVNAFFSNTNIEASQCELEFPVSGVKKSVRNITLNAAGEMTCDPVEISYIKTDIFTQFLGITGVNFSATHIYIPKALKTYRLDDESAAKPMSDFIIAHSFGGQRLNGEAENEMEEAINGFLVPLQLPGDLYSGLSRYMEAVILRNLNYDSHAELEAALSAGTEKGIVPGDYLPGTEVSISIDTTGAVKEE
ncbi:MAG: hypothetical protein JW969_16255 [Spirochaetales bacterium]|nr:hypothetical protein [Spirochaetales bacterium]